MFSALDYGITGRAIKNQILQVKFWNLRDFSKDKYRKVDESPYGGGAGMVMMMEPISKAISSIKKENISSSIKTIYLSPCGKLLTQKLVKALSGESHLILLAGRYKGIDERIKREIDDEISIGDYILSGGELAAMVMIDAITRLLPESVNNEDSVNTDSFSDGLLDHPHYTKPKVFGEEIVPEVLLSGNHELINEWRLKQSLGKTYLLRPDLLDGRGLTKKEKSLLDEFIKERED